jgi:hypothetical protein
MTGRDTWYMTHLLLCADDGLIVTLWYLSTNRLLEDDGLGTAAACCCVCCACVLGMYALRPAVATMCLNYMKCFGRASRPPAAVSLSVLHIVCSSCPLCNSALQVGVFLVHSGTCLLC